MPIVEEVKRIFEKLTGLRRPSAHDAAELARDRTAQLLHFKDDGETPNNPRLPLVRYRGAVQLDDAYDPAAIFEVLFASNGWADAWRNGIYDFLHFHTSTHEVLGIARGRARVSFGGAKGRTLTLKAGDVVILPAGVGHQRLDASDDLLVVGAYPVPVRTYDQPRPAETDPAAARAAIARVKLPRRDPVYGAKGPLRQHWKATASHLDRGLGRARQQRLAKTPASGSTRGETRRKAS